MDWRAAAVVLPLACACSGMQVIDVSPLAPISPLPSLATPSPPDFYDNAHLPAGRVAALATSAPHLYAATAAGVWRTPCR